MLLVWLAALKQVPGGCGNGHCTLAGTEAVGAPSIQALDGLFNGWNLSERWQNAVSE